MLVSTLKSGFAGVGKQVELTGSLNDNDDTAEQRADSESTQTKRAGEVSVE